MYKWVFLEQYYTSDLKTKEVYKMNFTIIKLKKKCRIEKRQSHSVALCHLEVC